METVRYLLANRRVRFTLMLFLITICFLIILRVLFQVEEFTVTKVSNNTDRSMSYDNGVLRAYDGSAFYKTSLVKNEAPRVLGGARKLPLITEAQWADDKGVLLNFDNSFINTRPDQVARNEGLTFSQKLSSTWYYDFESNDIIFVEDAAIYNSVTGFLNDKLTFVTSFEGAYVLNYFDVNTRKLVKTPLLSEDFRNVLQISDCPNNIKDTCIVALNSESKMGVYAVSQSGDIRELYIVDGNIVHVDGVYYAFFKRDDDVANGEAGAVANYGNINILNINTLDVKSAGGNYAAQGSLFRLFNNDNLAIVGQNIKTYQTISTKLGFTRQSVGELTTSEGDQLTNGIIVRSPSNNSPLFESTAGEAYVFAPRGEIKTPLRALDNIAANSKVESCLGIGESADFDEDQTTFSILIPDGKTFSRRVASVGNCINKKTELIGQYSFSFNSIDPINGRRTSN